MPVAREIQKVLPECYLWQGFCTKSKVNLTSHALIVRDHLYLVDPIRLSKSGLEELENLGSKPAAILLTNGNHERDAVFFQKRYDLPIHSHPDAAKEFTLTTTAFPPHLEGLKIIPLPGAGLGEIGIHFPASKLLCLGDILINLDSFAFAPLPDKYATDPKEMRQSIQLLTTLDVSILCFAHGLPITNKAAGRIATLVN